eukprot:TRINITY_DN16487_c0_g1_i1.p1 TRINITY_DN16487_c0_g1~~TRINITY_DN16487_c0_g1_i1.p1  ORF type:complete len:407 (+),score=21.78 TRINITY_DN16487_c0_g1_i1:104-1324(+)
MATVYAGLTSASLSRLVSSPSRAQTCISQSGTDASAVSAPARSGLSSSCTLSTRQIQLGLQHVHRSRGAETYHCVARGGFVHRPLAARPARLYTTPPGIHPAIPLLGFLAREPVLEQSSESRDRKEKSAGASHQIGWAMFASLLYAAPAQAAKYIPPPLGTSDAVPVTDDFTVEDLGGLAMLGIILLLVFLIGNIVLPSMMFSDVDTATSYKRDEEGDFYHDPSFTKDFFRQARETNDDIDEVPWSQAPFSKLAHEFSKVLPPPNSVAEPPEVSKKVNKGLEHLEGPIGEGVKLSGIVAVPGYGASVQREGQVASGQATSNNYVTSVASASESHPDSTKGLGDATSVEGGASAQGSVGAVRETRDMQNLKLYKLDTKAARRSKPDRMHERARGSGRHRIGGRHLND